MRPTDHDVRQRLTTDLSCNFLVEAGAGSGKTHSLAERMAAGVAAGRYEIGQMVAVTFTRKAAAELRGRFQLALEARLAAQPSGEEGERLERALAGIERFFAGTIHAFCARLLRERPVEAGVAPGFIELDEVDDDLARRRAWREFLARESATGAASLSALRAVDLRPADLDRAFTAVCEHADVTFPPGDAPLPDVDAAWRALDACWSEIQSHLPSSIDPATTCGVQRLAGAFAGRLALARRTRAADLAGLLDPWRSLQVRKKWWGTGASRGNPVADRIADVVAAFERDTVLPFLDRWRAWVYRQAIAVLVQGRDFYALERRRHNFVNYVDLLMMTARMLREHASVRRALQQKFRWLFIDEFQDTDPIQAEVFALLAADETGVAADVIPDWTSLPLRPGALFVVGDPKQSIYRFRRADIDTYMLVRRRIEACGGDVLRLTANFRSTPALCAFANRVFEAKFPPLVTPEAPAFEPLEPVRPEPGPGVPSVLAHVLSTDVQPKQSPAVEAERIAAWIRGAVEQGGRGFGDFLVLTRNRPRLKQYAQIFEREGIPVEVSGAGSFGGSSEVDTLRQLLMAFADPMDTPALVGVLRGPLFGLSDVDLFRFRQTGGRLDLSVRLDEESASIPDGTSDRAADEVRSIAACVDALRLLNRLFRRTRRLPLGAALEHVFEHTGLLAWAASTPSGAGAGDLLQALDRVRQLAERGGGWADAVAMLSDDAPEASDVEALPLEPG
ncbi:MAG: UvrD-helicase domain-containing protein, partial [Vicinamibacterales bacterium]